MNQITDTPEDFARDLYLDFMEFDDMNNDDRKKACMKVVKRLLNQLNDIENRPPTSLRNHYLETLNHIKKK